MELRGAVKQVLRQFVRSSTRRLAPSSASSADACARACAAAHAPCVGNDAPRRGASPTSSSSPSPPRRRLAARRATPSTTAREASGRRSHKLQNLLDGTSQLHTIGTTASPRPPGPVRRRRRSPSSGTTAWITYTTTQRRPNSSPRRARSPGGPFWHPSTRPRRGRPRRRSSRATTSSRRRVAAWFAFVFLILLYAQVERFDESLVALARLLGVPLGQVLYDTRDRKTQNASPHPPSAARKTRFFFGGGAPGEPSMSRAGRSPRSRRTCSSRTRPSLYV